MSDMEKTMELEMNPYDRLVEGYEGPAGNNSPELTGMLRHQVQASKQPQSKPQPQPKPQPRIKPVEIIPMSDKAVFNEMASREYGEKHVLVFELEEDMLVPDTEPDMDHILNIGVKKAEAGCVREEKSAVIRGEISLDILYRSADAYDDRLMVIESAVPFRRDWNVAFAPGAEVTTEIRVAKIEQRIINERKYRVKITINIIAQEIIDCERKMFEGIEGEDLEFLRENIRVMNIAFTKSKESEIDENLLINDEKIKPLKVLKSSFSATENHRQVTADKLVVNETIWVRILYAAELASQGNLSNHPMLFTAKIDNTQFIPLDGSRDLAVCRVTSDVSGLTAEVNEDVDGFTVKGLSKITAELYEVIERETVKDFFNMNDDMACDNKEEVVCCGIESKVYEHIVRETAGLPEEADGPQRVVYLDTAVSDVAVEDLDGQSQISGRLHMEIITVSAGGQSSLIKKFADFHIAADVPYEKADADDICIFVREMTADVTESNKISIMVQLQAEVRIRMESRLRMISNPCIIREEGNEKRYPVILYTVKENDSLWDIARKYRVSPDRIKEVNKTDDMTEGMKIVIAR